MDSKYLTSRAFQFTQNCLRLQASFAAILLISSCSIQTIKQTSDPAKTLTSSTATAIPDQASSSASSQTKTIPVELPADTGTGGLIAADLNGDGQKEIVITRSNFIAAYSLTEGKLWERSGSLRLSAKAEQSGVPGLHGPGVQAVDIDAQGITDTRENTDTQGNSASGLELLYLTDSNRLEVLSGTTGEVRHSVDLPAIESHANRWEHAIVANFSGNGDREVLLQASQPTDRDNYIRDSIQAAFTLSDLLSSGADTAPLWQTNDFVSLSHGSAKVFDINQDGKDEVVGATILSPTGETLYQANIGNKSFPHIDSIAVDDIDPQRPGLEAVIPEESGKERVILFDEEGEIWSDRHRRRSDDNDGDKVSIGNFDPDSPGLEMWFRGNESAHFTVLSAAGKLLSDYRFAEVKPETWTEKGFEIITRIRWTGDEKEYIVAKERHEAGDVGIFDALTGQMIAQYPAKTERLYVADVLGDWREEIIILEQDALKVIENTAANPNPDRPRLWEQSQYRRQKMTWNYYSP